MQHPFQCMLLSYWIIECLKWVIECSSVVEGSNWARVYHTRWSLSMVHRCRVLFRLGYIWKLMPASHPSQYTQAACARRGNHWASRQDSKTRCYLQSGSIEVWDPHMEEEKSPTPWFAGVMPGQWRLESDHAFNTYKTIAIIGSFTVDLSQTFNTSSTQPQLHSSSAELAV